MKIIASDVPFLINLTQISRHLIFLPRQGIQARMLAIREAIRHLSPAALLLLFAHGTIDPDPAFMPDAESELNGWSRSLEIFLTRVPESRVVTSIVSHVLDPGYMRHPLTWLQRARVDRQRLAIMAQLIQQMLGKKLDLVPHVSFGEALDWRAAKAAGDSLQAVVAAPSDSCARISHGRHSAGRPRLHGCREPEPGSGEHFHRDRPRGDQPDVADVWSA